MPNRNLPLELAAYIPRDRVENLVNGVPLPTDGVALIADISGFTPLTEALTHGLSPDQGAEELTRALDGVFTPLIAEVHAFGGSVIKFGGDALIVWYPRSKGGRAGAVVRRAITSAWRMQKAIKVHGQVPTPIGMVILKMKVGFTYGPIKRFNLGLAQYGFEDVLGGETLDRMAEAEHHAEPGDIMLDRATLNLLPSDSIEIAEWRDDFAAVANLLKPARRKAWPPLSWPKEDSAKIVNKLTPYVPQIIYQTLAAGQTQVAELKPVVSLFVQFHGIEYDSDPAVAEKLQTYFTTAQKVVDLYGGRLNRLITGDKGSLIHIIFGAPRTVEEQELRAIRCALDLQKQCLALPYISMQRIGVTVGRVFAGPVGAPQRHDYTTMGDSINLSARLMQNAANDQVLIETAVRQQLGPQFEIEDLGQIMVKGKAEAISVFAPLRFKDSYRRPETEAETQQIPIFGREQELTTFSQHLAELIGGKGRIMVLVGEVGMGKTHLFSAMRNVVGQQIIWADGICLAYGQTLSGYLFIDVMRALIDLPPGADPQQTSQHLLDFCRNLFGPNRLDSSYPYLARFMGLPLSGAYAQRIEGLSGESVRWQFFELFQEMLRLLMQERPLVLALDDLQWADPTSIQLIETLLPLVETTPLLLLLSMRPEHDRKIWQVREAIINKDEVVLGQLNYSASVALINHYAPNLPPHLLDFLVEKGGGNPLFLVEIIRTMEAQGLISDEIDLAQIELDALDLPNSVQGLLLAQIDRLTVEARHTLQMASVIGKVFLHKVLDVLSAGLEDLDHQLDTLHRQDYILHDDPTDQGLAYTFRHILIQESAYGTLLYERRRAYHQQVAEALEQLFPTQIAEQAGILSYHYQHAEDVDKAIYYTNQAADNARLLYANEEAEMLYQKVLVMLKHKHPATSEEETALLDRRAKTYLKIAQVRSNALDFEGAQAYYNQAFDLLEALEQRKPKAVAEDGTERVIRLGVLEHGPTTLDPGLAKVEDVSEIIVHLFEGLVELDTEMNIIPALAQRWDIQNQGRTYSFELHSNLKWSDNEPLTAFDFVFAWQRNLAPATEASLAYQLFIVEGAEEFNKGDNDNPHTIGVRAINERRLEITLKTPVGYFPYLLCTPITFPQPAHIIKRARDAWIQPENFICNGPFVISNWKSGERITLKKNKYYKGFSLGNIQRIQLKYLKPDLNNFLANKVDWCRIDNEEKPLHLETGQRSLIQYLGTFFVAFSCQSSLFSQLALRQAFAMCINQTELVSKVWSNVQTPANGGVVPPAMPGHSPEINLPFNPQQGRNLLNNAHIPNDTQFSLATFSGLGQTPEFLRKSWQRYLSVSVQIIEGMPVEEILDNLSSGKIQMALLGWFGEYPDPDSILRVLFHSHSPINYFGWRNNSFDELVDQAISLTDQKQRLALYHQADRILVSEDTAIIPLYYRQDYSLMRTGFKIEGVGKVIRGGMFKLKNIVVD